MKLSEYVLTFRLCVYTMTYMTSNPTRSLDLVDVENLLGTSSPDNPEAVVQINQVLSHITSDIESSITNVACSHRAAPVISFAWASCKLHWRSGPDGADLALIDAARQERLERFTHLVIASGDGIFAELAAEAASNGLHVIVVSHHHSLSNRLRLAANEVRYLPRANPILEVAAHAA